MPEANQTLGITEEQKAVFAEAVNKQIVATKMLRVGLDEQLQEMKKELQPSREVSLAITNLQQSIMWLGMNLKELGAKNPYPNSYDPSNTVVEPTADGLKL